METIIYTYTSILINIIKLFACPDFLLSYTCHNQSVITQAVSSDVIRRHSKMRHSKFTSRYIGHPKYMYNDKFIMKIYNGVYHIVKLTMSSYVAVNLSLNPNKTTNQCSNISWFYWDYPYAKEISGTSDGSTVGTGITWCTSPQKGRQCHLSTKAGPAERLNANNDYIYGAERGQYICWYDISANTAKGSRRIFPMYM